MERRVVISHFERPFEWSANIIADEVIVYNKSKYIVGTNFCKVCEISNVGRDVHTFFFDIVMNAYHKNDAITFFLQDYPFDHFEDCVQVINELKLDQAKLTIGGYYGFHHNTIGTMWDLPQSSTFNGRALYCLSNGHPQDHNPEIDVDRYWRILFKGEPPRWYEFMPGGHFAITSEQLRKRPLSFYWKIVDLLETEKVAPWLIERLEPYIFDERFEINDFD